MNVRKTLLPFCLFYSLFLYAQPALEPSARLNPSTERNASDTDIAWTEDSEARTVFTSTWYSNDGQIKIIHRSRPVNYADASGKLVPINPIPVRQKNGSWVAEDQPFPTSLYPDGSYSISLDHGRSFTFGTSSKVNATAIPASFEVHQGEVSFAATLYGIRKHLSFRENGVKYSYVLPQVPFPGNDLVFSEQLNLPEGYTLERDYTYGERTRHGWSGDLILADATGEPKAKMQAAVCFDNAGNQTIASYDFIRTRGGYEVKLTVPSEWLNDPSRSFPVVIDPLVQGPTAAWTGGTMPSCFVPGYNADSILVTIPGGISVTELNVTASFYADPFTTAIMADGRMFFSTSCGNTQTFSITGTPGQSAGTAYLEYFDLHNPLTCCFAESCTDQTFYLSYHLGRVALGSGCNTTYIRYDPFTTSWPFEAVVVGRTPETYGGQWSVSPNPICSNDCTINGTAYVYYGVPPYTFTHPWSTDTIVTGTNVGCANGATNQNFTLTIPNCPNYCDSNFTSLDVPPATIVDACGNVVTGLPTKTVPIKVTPQVTANYNQDVCSGSTVFVDISPCVSGTTMSWSGNGESGNTDIIDTLVNTGESSTVVSYQASAELNGCFSDTIDISIMVNPLPVPEFSYLPDPMISGLPATFTDATNFNGQNGVLWDWSMGDGTTYIGPENEHVFVSPGQYQVCLHVIDQAGCTDSICKTVPVVPAEVERPNVVTANNDGVNDLLIFNYLDFYPDNEIYIYNRWGNLVYQCKSYQNDWNGVTHTEGTYYYTLIINETGDSYTGFFQLIK